MGTHDENSDHRESNQSEATRNRRSREENHCDK